MDELCLCSYNWRIIHWLPNQLMLIYRCLPEYTYEVARRLRDRKITCRPRAKGTVCVRNAQALVKLAKLLGVGPELDLALDKYAETWALSRKGQKRAPGVVDRQTQAARKVMALVPLPTERPGL